MKGIILSEFVEFLEVTLGEDRAHKIIDSSGVKSVGAYSRVGLYEYQELIKLLTQAVSETCTEADVLVEGFSDHLFKTFKRDASVFFEGVSSAAEMLTIIFILEFKSSIQTQSGLALNAHVQAIR